MTMIADFMTKLGCRLRLDNFEHEGLPYYRLHLGMPADDGRWAEVLLSDEDLTTLVRKIRENDEQ